VKPADIAGSIEHSLLTATATGDDIRVLCAEAVEHGFYSVCVNPSRVSLAREALEGSNVRLTTVVGFPLGAGRTQVKAREAMDALYLGADEVDMVIDLGAALEGDWSRVERDISEVQMAIKGPSGGAVLKVIIECCYLDDELKKMATKTAVRAGADYVKTSTGFGTSGARAKDVALMWEVLQGRARIKAAGGIKTLESFTAMKEAGAHLIGTSSGVSIMKEAAKLRP
jgi:deoxyribose-phosphate aldolase